jgi:hypothetical protein
MVFFVAPGKFYILVSFELRQRFAISNHVRFLPGGNQLKEISMRKVLFPLASAVLLASASIAFAADASGTIKSIDKSNMTLTLDNGSTYELPSTLDTANLKEGAKVNVTYSEEDGKMKASEVTPES